MKQVKRSIFFVVLQYIFLAGLVVLFIFDEKFIFVKPAIVVLFLLVFNIHRKVRVLSIKQDFTSVDMAYRISQFKKKGEK